MFTVAGQTFTALQAVSFIQNVLNAVAATATAKGAWKKAILAEDKLVAADGDTVKMIRNAIAAMLSTQINTPSAFVSEASGERDAANAGSDPWRDVCGWRGGRRDRFVGGV